MKKAHAVLDEAIRQDPDYPLNYYNLACALAGEGDRPKMLANLALAFQQKDHVLKGDSPLRSRLLHLEPEICRGRSQRYWGRPAGLRTRPG